jgi:hypothetical protein
MILASGLWHVRRQQQRMGVRVHGQRQAREFVLQVYQLVDLTQATTMSQRRVVVLSTFHTQRPTPDSITTTLKKKGAAGQDRAQKALACFLC